MDRYIGLDVHAQSSTVAVISATGKRLRSLVVPTSGEALIEAIRSINGQRHVCIEEGTQSEWLHEILGPHAAEVVVVIPVKRSGQKSDERDAWALAEDFRLGTLKPVYKAPRAFQALRDAARAQRILVRDTTRTKNRLKAVYRSRGVLAEGEAVYSKRTREAWQAKLPSSSRELAKLLSAQLDALLELKAQAEETLAREARRHPIVARLSKVPGFGPTRAAQLVSIVMSPHRFRTKRQFWSYCGLGIVMRSSSDWQVESGKLVRKKVLQTRGLNTQRQPLLKMIFKGAATTVIQQLPEHPLHQDYLRSIQAGVKANLARLTLARRLAGIVLAMWKHQEDYDVTKHQRRITE
jgi:transposase